MTRRNDEGAALILAMMLIMVLSAISISLMFLSQTETYASMNYRLMSQARYGAESGVHKVVNYLLNGYPQPGSVSDPLSNYDATVSPVTFGGQPVILSAMTGVGSNYPVGATTTAFNTNAQGTLSVGGYNVQYTAYATLLSIRQVATYATGTTSIVQTWRITADGTIAGPRPATVEVSATLEQEVVATHTYGVFATNPGCGAITWGGASQSDSYDSTSMTMTSVGGPPVTQTFGGDVGTNGNLGANGNAVIYGTLSTPRTGVGSCQSGAVDALTTTGHATVTGGVIQLPQALTYPTPALPNPLPPTNSVGITKTTTCAAAGISATVCAASTNGVTITPSGTISLGNISLTGGAVIHLKAGTYNVNSFSMAGNSALIIDSGPVIMNVAGQGTTSPLDFAGGSVTNGSFLPTDFQILYAGTDAVKLVGGTASSAMVFAPNAPITVAGGSDFYGAILGASVTDTGGTKFHYDRHLANNFMTVGNFMLSAFTWKKY